MGFQQGLSGLNAASTALNAVSNNIANSGTVGFKSADAQFADVYAASLSGVSATQVGIGTSVGNVAQNYTQGNITTTSNSLDIAVNGQGFFRMDHNGTITWTRNGQFQVDKDGYIVNAQASRLTGYLANTNGTIVQSSPADIKIDTSDIAPVATGQGVPATGVVMGMNLNSTLTSPSAATGAVGTGAVLTFPVAIVTGTNDTLSVTLNGTTQTVTVAGAVAPGTSYASAAALATAVQAAMNAAFPTTGAGVSVTASGNSLVLTTQQTGAAASLAVAAGAGATSMLGGAVAATTGTQNFTPTNPLSYNSSTSATVFDSLGNQHTLALYFVKNGVTPNQWSLYTTLDGNVATMSPATALTFSTSGALLTPANGIVAQSFPITTGGVTNLTFPLNLSGTTQYGSAFGVNSLTQDGYASGRLSGLNVSSDGTIQGTYSNGQTRDLAQVALGKFTDPNGLISIGGNQWQETAASGQPLIGAPGTGALGVLQSGAVEESNVDLTSQLVNLITDQRAYQANAQSIKTQDAILQTLVNLQ